MRRRELERWEAAAWDGGAVLRVAGVARAPVAEVVSDEDDTTRFDGWLARGQGRGVEEVGHGTGRGEDRQHGEEAVEDKSGFGNAGMHREVSLECSLEVRGFFGSMWVDLFDDGKHGERKELQGGE